MLSDQATVPAPPVWLENLCALHGLEVWFSPGEYVRESNIDASGGKMQYFRAGKHRWRVQRRGGAVRGRAVLMHMPLGVEYETAVKLLKQGLACE